MKNTYNKIEDCLLSDSVFVVADSDEFKNIDNKINTTLAKNIFDLTCLVGTNSLPLKSFFESMERNLKLSKINLDPIKKNLKVLIFSFLYLSIIYEWLKEDSSNNEKVMAILDQRLSLIENILI